MNHEDTCTTVLPKNYKARLDRTKRQVLKTYVQAELEAGLLSPSEVVNATHEAVAEHYRQHCEAYRQHCEAHVRQLVQDELRRFKDEQGHVDVPHLLDRVIRLEQGQST
jgi:hypothetical protein